LDAKAPVARDAREAAMTEPATRAVISDDGTIRLTLYAESGALATVPLSQHRALMLAMRLLEAALRHSE
jgi:hypothetical protein